MARYSASSVSQTAQLAGMPSGTTVNGYIGYWGANTNVGFRVRKVLLGVRGPAGNPQSQQITVEVHRQTVAPAGTGLAAAILGQRHEPWVGTDPTVGLITTTATTIGTTGPTLDTVPIRTLTMNTQSTWEEQWEFTDELVCLNGTANGIAFVNIGQTLPASHFITLDVTVEV